MVVDGKTALCRDFFLPTFDFLVEKFFYAATLQAHQVIMMPALVEFVDGFVAIEMVANQQSGLLELRQYAINGGQPDVHVLGDEQAIHFFCGQMPFFGILEQVENFKARQGGFQADAFQIAGVAHGVGVSRAGYLGYDRDFILLCKYSTRCAH